MKVSIFDLGGVRVTQIGPNTVCVKTGRNWIYLTYKELTDVAEAVAQHLEPAAEPFFIEEDLEAGRQAIAQYVDSIEE